MNLSINLPFTPYIFSLTWQMEPKQTVKRIKTSAPKNENLYVVYSDFDLFYT